MKTHGGATDYWRVRTNFNVGETHGNEPGSLANGQLPATKWADEDDSGFPGGGSATFAGGMTAIHGTAFLDGDMSLAANRIGTWEGSYTDAISWIEMRMTNISNAHGDQLKNASGVEFYTLAINGVSIYTYADNQVAFNSAGYQFGSVVIGADGTFTTLTGT